MNIEYYSAFRTMNTGEIGVMFTNLAISSTGAPLGSREAMPRPRRSRRRRRLRSLALALGAALGGCMAPWCFAAEMPEMLRGASQGRKGDF